MKFHIHTYGCQMNVRDSEAVGAMLEAAGHVRAEGESDADLIIVNSCTVRQKAEEKAIGKCGNLGALKDRPRIVGLMGCAVKRLGEEVFKKLPKLDFAVGPRRFGMIPKIVADLVEQGYPSGNKAARRLELPDEDEVPSGLDAHPDAPSDGSADSFRSFVTVLLGCDNRCSYCIVPDVRGHEYSRPAKEVIAEVRALASRGIKEVCLLGQSVLRYGVRNKAWFEDDSPSEYKEPFPRLLEALQDIPGLERIRFTSAHPKGCTDELVRAFRECTKVCRHLHLPVQSGSDRVLAEMGRRYTRAEYLAAVKKLRDFDPEFALTTDVIVGYPGETEEDFEATRSLMEEAGFDNAFVFKYSPRPGTRSAQLPDDVPTAEKERRDQVLLADQERRGIERNGRLVGTIREVLVEGPSLRNKSRWSGRDSGNRIVVFEPTSRLEIGSLVKVRILDAHPQILIGEIV
ncbi:MAG: tRNA (N6-isopentenyl adenosine(37)-C2)-methylthiotransferase MiaB [Kiritimatiellae bacterium]|nr:tRNA (N6-isopentenyl adenosine(37)-C2)-methylthiotransferase MiaB [Kiritimatiellia bacterium]